MTASSFVDGAAICDNSLSMQTGRLPNGYISGGGGGWGETTVRLGIKPRLDDLA